MDNLEKKIKKIFITLLVFSVLFVAAIPMIPVGFVKGWLFIAIPSIVIVVAGFYGMPLGWIAWASLRKSRNLVRAITVDGITKVADLAANFGEKPKMLKKEISELLKKGYLAGYKFGEDGTELEKVEKQAAKKVRAAVCDFCGAALPPDAEGVCQYCGAKYKFE
jgi:ribosomal protein L40E